MDYKLLIILLVLLFLLILVYRELSTFKDDMLNNVTKMGLEMQNESGKMITRLQNNMIKCVSQIKGISSDNLNQLRKITLLNNQPITRNNHFTETDDSEVRTDVYFRSDSANRYLLSEQSGMYEDNKKNVKSKNGDFYMSESDDNDSSIDSEYISGTKSSKHISRQNIENIQEIPKETTETIERTINPEDNIEDEVKDEIKNRQNVIVDSVDPVDPVDPVDLVDPVDIPVYESKKDEDEIMIPTYKSKGIDEDNDIPIYRKGELIANDDYSEEDDIIEEKVNLVKVEEKKENNLENSFIDEDIDDLDDSKDSNEIAHYNMNMRKNPSHKNEIEVDVYNMLSGNKLPHLPADALSEFIPVFTEGSEMEDNLSNNLENIYINQNKIDSENDDDDRSLQDIDMSESLKNLINSGKFDKQHNFDEGSDLSKSNNSSIDSSSIDSNDSNSNNDSSNSSSSDSNDSSSSDSNDSSSSDSNDSNGSKKSSNNKNVMKVLKNNLGTLKDYKIGDLRDIAKKLSLPVSYKNKDQKKWTMLKKKDLYENIKMKLNNKKSYK